MGLAEVLPRLPRLIRRIRQTARTAREMRPAAVVTIDAPDFSFRVAKRLKGAGIPLVHYVAPTVWAWRPGRARKIAGYPRPSAGPAAVRTALFRARGAVLRFRRSSGDRIRCRQGRRGGVPPQPRDRPGGAGRLRAAGQPAQRNLASAAGFLGDPAASRRDEPVGSGGRSGGPVGGRRSRRRGRRVAVSGPGHPRRGREVRGLSQPPIAALAASGTVSLELALAGTPTVIAYRVSPLSAWIGRRLIRVRFVSLANIVLDREVVPEFLQERCRPDLLAPALGDLAERSGGAAAADRRRPRGGGAVGRRRAASQPPRGAGRSVRAFRGAHRNGAEPEFRTASK